MKDKINKLIKIWHIRENEKKDAQMIYRKSVDKVEDIESQLYEVKRQREVIVQKIEHQLQGETTIQLVKQNERKIQMLDKSIAFLEAQLNISRKDMNVKQKKLTEAYIEVKKYEKIIQNRKEQLKRLEEEKDKKFMDEIAIQQFVNSRGR